MSTQLAVNQFKIDFSDEVDLLLQEMGSKLRGYVRMQSHKGSKQASPVNQVGAIRGSTPAGRFAPLNRIDASTDRRWVFPTDRELAQALDNFDALRYDADYIGPYAENAAMDIGRWMDDLIISAALGNARTGELGAGTEAFDTTNFRVAANFGTGGSDEGLTVDKLIEVRKIFREAHVNLDAEEPTLVIGPEQEADLLRQLEVTSSDFNGMKPTLVDGRVTRFLGMNIVVIERQQETDPEGGGLAVVNTDQRRCFAFVKSGIHLGMWKDISTRVDERKDLSGIPYQVYTCATAGATRLEQGRVVEILCDEG